MLIRTKRSDRGGEQWLMFHKDDAEAVEGWDPEDHPRSVLSGRTNDEVLADPDARWSSDLPPDRAEIRLHALVDDDPQLLALDELGAKGEWEYAGRVLRLTNLDKVLFDGRGDGGHGCGAGDQAGVHPALRPGRAAARAPARGPGGQPAPVPQRRRRAGLLAQGGAQAHPRLDRPLGQPHVEGG